MAAIGVLLSDLGDGDVEAEAEGEAVEVTVVDPPVAWYALRKSSRFRIAASRSPSGQPDCAQGFVLQQPQKVPDFGQSSSSSP